jgi:hypothetical protein
MILEKAGKRGFGLTCASPFPCVCSSVSDLTSNYTYVLRTPPPARDRRLGLEIRLTEGENLAMNVLAGLRVSCYRVPVVPCLIIQCKLLGP